MSPTEIKAIAQIDKDGPIEYGLDVIGVKNGRVSLRTLSQQGLITYSMNPPGWVVTELGRLLLKEKQ